MNAPQSPIAIILSALAIACALLTRTPNAQELREPLQTDHISLSPWHGGMRFSGAIGLPFGEFYHDLSWGPGAGIEMIISATAHTSVRLGVSRVGINDNADSILAHNKIFFRLIEDNLSARVWKIFAAAEYRNWSETNPAGGPMYFIFGGLGILNHALEGQYLLLNESTQELYRLGAPDEGETRLIILAGAGGMVPLGGGVALDLTGEFNVLPDKNENRNGAFYSRIDFSAIIELKLGVVVLFQ
jgi:hypothetical protein